MSLTTSSWYSHLFEKSGQHTFTFWVPPFTWSQKNLSSHPTLSTRLQFWWSSLSAQKGWQRSWLSRQNKAEKAAMSQTKSFQPVTVGQKKSLSLSYLVLIILNLSQFEATTGTGIFISNSIKFPKLWKINQSRRLSPFWDRPFGETFGNEKERIVKQVQPVQLCKFSSMPSE